MYSNCNQTGIANNDGFIQLWNMGHYLVAFAVTFLYQGNYFTISSGILDPYPYRINIPGSATNILLDVSGYYDPSECETIYLQRFSSPPKNCYISWGTPGNWGCRQIPCGAISTNPCSCNCSCNCSNNCYPNYYNNCYSNCY